MKIRKIADSDKWHFYCPGCKHSHWFDTNRWTWNNDSNNPTITPSILANESDPSRRCHLFVKEGKIQFLSDCWHELKGTTIEMEDAD